jgi:hypothetical protein
MYRIVTVILIYHRHKATDQKVFILFTQEFQFSPSSSVGSIAFFNGSLLDDVQ